MWSATEVTALLQGSSKAYAYHNKVEVQGMIPTEVIKFPEAKSRSRWGREFNSA